MNDAYNESLKYSTQEYGIEIVQEYMFYWTKALDAWKNGQNYKRNTVYDGSYKMISREYDEAIEIVKAIIELFPTEIHN